MTTNRLKFNPDTMEVGAYFAFGSGCTLMRGGGTLPRKDQICRLGLLLEPAPSRYIHRFGQGLVHQRQLFLESRGRATVTRALVILRLGHCNALHMGLPLERSRTLQHMQVATARRRRGGGKQYGHVTPVSQTKPTLSQEILILYVVYYSFFKKPKHLKDSDLAYGGNRRRPFFVGRGQKFSWLVRQQITHPHTPWTDLLLPPCVLQGSQNPLVVLAGFVHQHFHLLDPINGALHLRVDVLAPSCRHFCSREKRGVDKPPFQRDHLTRVHHWRGFPMELFHHPSPPVGVHPDSMAQHLRPACLPSELTVPPIRF